MVYAVEKLGHFTRIALYNNMIFIISTKQLYYNMLYSFICLKNVLEKFVIFFYINSRWNTKLV